MGDTASEIVKSAIAQPERLIQVWLNREGLSYAWQLLVPNGVLPVGGWWSVVATPEATLNRISLKPAQQLIFSHYTAGIVPWLTLGSIWCVAWIVHRWPGRTWWPTVILGWVAVAAGYSAYTYGPLPGALLDHSRFATWRNDYVQVVRYWARTIPATAAVSVTNNIGSQFARRQKLYSFPLGIDQADYLVILQGHATPVVASQEEVTLAVEALERDDAWQRVERRGDLTVWQRQR
jgi:hypothetical protein